MQSKKNSNYLPTVVYVILFLVSLTVFSLHSFMGTHMPSFWGHGLDVMRLDPTMINGVEITSFTCPKFFDDDEGAEVTISIKNKDDRWQTAGVVLLISKLGQIYDETKLKERMRLEAGEERSFVWRIDRSNLVDNKVSLRLFLAQTPDHPAHSSRACLILPWRGPFSVSFMNIFAYPLLMLLFILSAIWLYYKSGIDWQNRKRFFFFLFANTIVFVMFLSLLIRFYTGVLIALPFLVLGIVATLQTHPYIPVDEYKYYIDEE